MALSDLLHGLFVLLTTVSFALPVYEGFQRRSPFYVVLFSLLCIFSFALHCEETGICDPLTHRLHVRLTTVDLSLSYYLLMVMLMVVLEIRAEVLGRCVSAVAVAIMAAINIADLKVNLSI